MSRKVAVVLLNLGGPDSLKSVRPFLFNLFYDINILRFPFFIRYPLAWLISKLRESEAKNIYSHIGGKSTILDETTNQAKKLEDFLHKNNLKGDIFKVFVSMRHWKPFSNEVVKDLNDFYPDQIILLPLYPHFSTTTTKSSVEDIIKKINSTAIRCTTLKTICCYSDQVDFINTHTSLISEGLNSLNGDKDYIILFSAHGLPVKFIEDGDGYQNQIENSVKNIVKKLKIKENNYKITYQSKVGPLEWLTPTTENEIKNACDNNKDIIIVPISFVSEHSETLFELDIEYANLVKDKNIKYVRIPTLSVNEVFIKSLGNMVSDILDKDVEIKSGGDYCCPNQFFKCLIKNR